MAASATVTERTFPSVKKVVWSWTSSALGAVSQATMSVYDGEILGLLTDPDGTAAPTADYDITITDDGGHDVLIGSGADRHTANTEYVDRASLAAVSSSKLTLNVTSAGDTKKGVVVVWVR